MPEQQRLARIMAECGCSLSDINATLGTTTRQAIEAIGPDLCKAPQLSTAIKAWLRQQRYRERNWAAV